MMALKAKSIGVPFVGSETTVTGNDVGGDVSKPTLKLQHDWALEKVAHMASIITYRYGIEATPVGSHEDDDYLLILEDTELGLEWCFSGNSVSVIKSDLDEETSSNWLTFVAALPLYCIDLVSTVDVSDICPCNVPCDVELSIGGRFGLCPLDMTEAELLEGVASEKSAHIASILQYRYGIESWSEHVPELGEYRVHMTDLSRQDRITFGYAVSDIIGCNANFEASGLRRLFVSNYIY